MDQSVIYKISIAYLFTAQCRDRVKNLLLLTVAITCNGINFWLMAQRMPFYKDWYFI